jgi:hypothetical protein
MGILIIFLHVVEFFSQDVPYHSNMIKTHEEIVYHRLKICEDRKMLGS